MIREHAFNSRWAGEPAGIVDEAAFFELPPEEQRARLAPFSWVEFRAPVAEVARPDLLTRAGFFQADTQVHFRIGLGQLPPATEELEVHTAAEEPFEISPDEMAPFSHERFLLVPGSSAERVNERYALWCRDMIAREPQNALRVRFGGQVQGWFVSTREPRGMRLALAMAHREARVSGFSVYEQALRAYAAAGARVGFASFSVTNSAVHNIYARLGARFMHAEGCWLWSASDQRRAA